MIGSSYIRGMNAAAAREQRRRPKAAPSFSAAYERGMQQAAAAVQERGRPKPPAAPPVSAQYEQQMAAAAGQEQRRAPKPPADSLSMLYEREMQEAASQQPPRARRGPPRGSTAGYEQQMDQASVADKDLRQARVAHNTAQFVQEQQAKQPAAAPKVASQYDSFPAPTNGLNLRDAKQAMDPRDALVLDNWFPEQTFVRLRGGSEPWATRLPGPVETVMEWAGPSSAKFFAATLTKIYDITAGGAVGAADVTGLANARFQHVNFTNSAGDGFLVICNGADDVRNYNGASWSTPSITGVTSADLINVASHKRRLWFVEKESTNAWYLPVDAVAGAAAKLDLGAVFKHGGRLLLIGSLSQDSGSGPDDLLAFLSSNGEIVVYQGTDPSSANTWAQVGTFRAGAPVGDRALLKVGGDLADISADGVVSVQQMLVLDRSMVSKASVSNKIDPAFAAAYQLYASNWGWQAIVYPRGHMALVNIPVNSSTTWQYAMNTQTQAWCRFTGLNAKCWGLFGEELYYGTEGAVMKFDTGTDDNGAAIEGDMQPAFKDFGSGTLTKHFKMVRPLFRSNAFPTLAILMNTDYSDDRPTSADALAISSSAPTWGTAVWGAFTWTGQQVQKAWFACVGSGFVASPRLYTSTATASIELDAIDVIYEQGQEVAV